MKSVKELLQLLKSFSKIPVNDNDEIEEAFLHFDKGTDRFDVLSWLESQNEKFCIADYT